jgi:hypothetical protein
MTTVTLRVRLKNEPVDVYQAVLQARMRLEDCSIRGIVEDKYPDIDREVKWEGVPGGE